jgi:hypothetical protein
MERKPGDALPGGAGALRTAVWEFIWPMLSPALVALNRDALIVSETAQGYQSNAIWVGGEGRPGDL